MSDLTRLTERQHDMMEILWDRGSVTVREAKNALAERGEDLAYTSVLTVFQTLEKNGVVRHEPEGKAYRYFPALERDQAASELATWLVQQDVEYALEVGLALQEDPRVQNAAAEREDWP